MAHANTSTDTTHGVSIRHFFDGILDFLAGIADNNSRVKEVSRLQALSNAELAERGIGREDIVRHVFRDVYYL